MNSDFKVSNAEALIFIGDTIANLKKDFDGFKSFTPVFNQEYVDSLVGDYNDVMKFSSDNVLIDEQAQATAEVNDQLEACRKFFQKMKFYIELAFPKSQQIWNQFGYNDYEEARKSAKPMLIFMNDLELMSNKYSDKLNNQSFDKSKIEEITILKNKLRDAINWQTNKKHERSDTAFKRNQKLNLIYEKLGLVFKAAKIIYENDSQKLELYKFPAPKVKKDNKILDD